MRVLYRCEGDRASVVKCVPRASALKILSCSLFALLNLTTVLSLSIKETNQNHNQYQNKNQNLVLSKSIFVTSERAHNQDDKRSSWQHVQSSALAVDSSALPLGAHSLAQQQQQPATANFDDIVQVEQEQDAHKSPGSVDDGSSEKRFGPFGSPNQLEGLFQDAPGEITLLQTIKNQTHHQSEKESAEEEDEAAFGQVHPIEQLDRDFLTLFDELWLIKDKSTAALVQLNFFKNQSSVNGVVTKADNAHNNKVSVPVGSNNAANTGNTDNLPTNILANKTSSNYQSLRDGSANQSSSMCSTGQRGAGSGSQLNSCELSSVNISSVNNERKKPSKVMTDDNDLETGRRGGNKHGQQQQEQKMSTRSKQDLYNNMARTRLGQAASRVSGWLSEAQVRLRRAKEKLLGVVLTKVTNRKASPAAAAAAAAAAIRSGPQDARGGGADTKQTQGGGGADDSAASYGGGPSDPEGGGGGGASDKAARSRRSASTLSPAQGTDVVTVETSNAEDASSGQLRADALRECNPLTIDEEHKCRDLEALVNVNLNHSFPGTTRSIESNCKHITHLLANCWPAQLDQLKQSLSTTWSDDLLHVVGSMTTTTTTTTTEATTAITSVTSGRGPPVVAGKPENDDDFIIIKNSCGVESRSPQYIRDRVSWMWLNLCIDKRFRQDYIDNLRCLSTWNQEKAQQTCNYEYERMQTYLASQAGHGFEWTKYSQGGGGGGGNNPQQQHNNKTALALAKPTAQQHQQQASDASITTVPWAQTRNNDASAVLGGSESPVQERPSASSGTPTSAGGGGIGGGTTTANNNGRQIQPVALSESELVDREINSKLLCCMFDQFLRCVHKQAIRDCGRPGAQFVVNFLSRIGTDDMKHLCNSESRGNETSSSHGAGASAGAVRSKLPSTRKSNADRSPFIGSNYCTEPKIQAALIGLNEASGASPSAVGSGAQRTLGSGRNKARPSNSFFSHDPTFFGSYGLSSSSANKNKGLNTIIGPIILIMGTFVAFVGQLNSLQKLVDV